MEYVYAAMMLHSAGQEVTEENITKVLEAGGTEVDEARVKALTAALEDVDIDEAIESTAAAAPAPAQAGGESEVQEGGAEEEEAEEEAEEEEEEEEEETEGAAGMGELFG